MLKSQFESKVQEGRDKLKAIDEQIAGVRAEMTEAAKEYFATEFYNFFAANPDLVKVSWTQYTPHWNDGETCKFRAHHDYPSIYVMNEGEETNIDDMKNWQGLSKLYEPKVKAILGFLTEKDIALIFGEDDQEVIITREGVSVVEYSDHE